VEIINFQILTVSDIVLLASFLFVFIIQVYYLLRYYLKLALHKDGLPNSGTNPMTVILSVRNEEERIREILDKFKEQKFEDYQILVINAYSEDNTMEILNVLTETNSRLKVTSLNQEARFSEKQVINIGLKGSSTPWIIFLTSSIGNINPEWLNRLHEILSPEIDAVIAYNNVEHGKGFRNLMCRLERFTQFLISGSWTLSGKPFVFNETNVLFKRSMYFETQGFRQKLNRNFANLELIFNENFKKGKVKIATNPEAAFLEHIEDNRGDHRKLLRKGVQIRQSLSWGKRFSLFFDDLTKILMLGLTTALILIYPEYWITIVVILIVYLIILAIIVKMVLNRLRERKIFLSSLVYIIIKPIINWWLVWRMYIIYRRNKWN